MMSGPGSFFALSPKRDLWGALRPEASFIRQTPSAWGTLNPNPLSPGSRQPYWQLICHAFGRALSRAPSGVTWLLPSQSTQGVKSAAGGFSPSANPTSPPPPGLAWPHGSTVHNLRVQNLPIRFQDPRLNWVPGDPPMNTPNADLHALRCALAFFNQSGEG